MVPSIGNIMTKKKGVEEEEETANEDAKEVLLKH